MEQNKTNVSFAKRITASPEVKKGFTVFLGVVTAIVIGMLMLEMWIRDRILTVRQE